MGQTNSFSIGSAVHQANTATAISSAFSVFNNPATISSDSTFIGIAARQYFLEVNEFSLAGSYSLPSVSLGLGLSSFGDEFYQENIASVGVKKRLSTNVSIGTSLLYTQYNTPLVNPQGQLIPQLGIEAMFSNQFTLASTIRNPLGQRLDAPFDMQNQTWFSLGMTYKPNAELQTTLQTDLLEQDGFSAAFGGQYLAYRKLGISLGGRVNPQVITAGIFLRLNGFETHIGGQQQQLLGYTPALVAQKGF